MKVPNQEKTWDKIAKPWKEFRVKIPQSVEKFLKNKKGKILDLGCGSGRNFAKISGLSWYGVDFSKQMLKYAKKRAEKLGINLDEIKKAEADNLPFEDNYFDAVLCYAVLHGIDGNKKRKKILKEIYRVLKSGGVGFVSVWGKKSPRLKNKTKECFVPWTTQLDKPTKRYTYIYNKDELEKEISKAGFEILNSWEERNINVVVKKP
tara:strand:+ start:230 stop:847 length:618 start_codon:yes stop_codon:yes gene_type:complete